ncbi:MAG: MFS transporter [Gemmatimonadales bacterium]|nr:MFS transporter [Gemmatimonadales bacterium]
MSRPAAGRHYGWYALGLLSALNLLNYITRNSLFAVFGPIKHELGVTDAQLGWTASAYILVFSLAALPFGVLSDLRSRRAVITLGVVLWSALSVASGFVTSFAWLVVCRAGMGLGGAAFTAAAQSIVADYFPIRGRALAMAVLASGNTVGGVLGIWLGGQLADSYSWRLALIVVGVPGLALAFLAARLRDPARPDAVPPVRELVGGVHLPVKGTLRRFAPLMIGLLVGAISAFMLDRRLGVESDVDIAVFGLAVLIGLALNIVLWAKELERVPVAALVSEAVRAAPAAFAGLYADLARALGLVLRTPTLVYIFAAGALLSFGMNGLVGWAPTFMARELGLSITEAAILMGTWGLAAGLAGTVVGGLLADALRRRTAAGRVIVVAAGMILGAPLTFWLLTLREMSLFVPVFCGAFFFLSWINGPIAAVIFDVVQPRIGATVAGAYLLFIHLAGDTVAFPLVGALSDRYGISRAVLLLPGIALLGGLAALPALRTVETDMRRAAGPA